MFLTRRTVHLDQTSGEAPNGAGATPAPTEGKAAPAADPPKEVAAISLTSEQFKQRLAEAGESSVKKFLKSLGFEKGDDLQTVLQTAKALQDEKKTEKERLEGRIKELEPQAQKASSLSKRFETLVNAEFEKLPETVQQAIDRVADGDAERRWDQLEVLRAAGLVPSGTSSSGEPPKAAPPKPANAGPNTPAPKQSGEAITKFQEWDALRKTAPTRASIFYQLHGTAIEASRPAET